MSLASQDDEDCEEQTMNRVDRDRLVRCRKSIVDDLEVRAVTDFLLEKGVLDPETVELINSMNTCSDKARKLLDILPTRGPRAFSLFVESLRADYEWLVEDLESNGSVMGKESTMSNKVDSAEARLKTILMKGGVPHEPSHSIVRENVIKQVKLGLENLESGQFLVLHGMAGSGKSVLAAEAVRDPDITLKYFPDGVFWFRVGMLEKDKLFNRMKILCEKLEAQVVPSNIEHAQEILRRLFLSDFYGQSLVILDDVWSSDIIQTFNVSGRVVVTTQDISVMDVISASQKNVVAVQQGFTKEESLRLFSSFVDVPPEYLPDEAQHIHNECKGSPMVISMIGGLISETGRHQKQRQSGRWAYYLRNLRSRRYSKFKKQRSYQHESVMEAVMLSIENLNEKLKSRYEELAVFLDDVGIPTKSHQGSPRWYLSLRSSQLRRSKGVKFGGIYNATTPNKLYYQQMSYRGAMLLPFQVLMTYWKMDRFEVEDVMTEFLKKSMAQSEFDTQLDSYVYSIHDLQLDYLKSHLKDEPEKERDLHWRFLDQYFSKVNYQYGLIEDDSYIFFNLGYHLFKSERFDLFPEIYLNLSFVEAMLKATGPVDLLNDYKKFESHIMGMKEEHLDALEDYEAFSRTIGALVNTAPHTDVIQLALSEPKESEVYKSAHQLATLRPEKLYFNWVNRGRVRGQHEATILHHGMVQAACFLMDMTKILTSNGDGQIKVWDVHSGDVLHRFTGHKANVGTLALSPRGDFFASGSEDGAIKVWDLGSFQDEDEREPDDAGPSSGEEERQQLRKPSVKGRSGSQRTRQTVGSILTFGHELRDLSNMSYIFNELNHEQVMSVDFSPDGEEVVAGGQSGMVKVFNLRARRQRLTLDGHKETANVARFSHDGRTICSGSDDPAVMLWDSSSGEFLGSVNVHDLRVLDVAFVPDSPKVISMSADKLVQWESPVRRRRGVSLEIEEFHRTREANFNCMALSKKGQKLAAGTVDRIVTVWDVETMLVCSSLPGHSDHIYTLDFTHEDNFLLSGSADETVMVWSMGDIDEENADRSYSFGPACDAKFFKDNSCRMVAPDDANAVQILEDGRPVIRSPPDVSRITAVALGNDGETVAYGCFGGQVRLFRSMQGILKQLGKHQGKVNDVMVTSNSNTVVSAGDDRLVMIFHDGDKVFTCGGFSSPVSSVFFFSSESAILSRCRDGCVRTWSAVSGELQHEFRYPDTTASHVTFADVSSEAALVALAKATGVVDLLSLTDLSHVRQLNPPNDPGGAILGPVRVCRFSQDGSILAVGFDSGSLELWDAQTGVRVCHLLQLHESWVTDIRFGGSSSDCAPTRMVTVGDKIAWWSLEVLKTRRVSSTGSLTAAAAAAAAATNTNTANASGAGPTSPSSLSSAAVKTRKVSRDGTAKSNIFRRPRQDSESASCIPEATHTRDHSPGVSTPSPRTPGAGSKRASKYEGEISMVKLGSAENKDLLQTFDIKGNSMSRIFASADFHKFVTVDDAGLAYVLEEIMPAQFN